MKISTLELRPFQVIKCPAVAFALRAKAPKFLGKRQNIFNTAGHFIFWRSLILTHSRLANHK
ncbi:hypothetical protein B4U84_28785 [Westiellopsis prolifica IICB1]|nr:hypothetical protein B4U84_28785 [Westiellopsis prolifica IICB1]